MNMRFSDAIQAIKARISLVDLASRYMALRQNGVRYVAPCPFHQETKPSFSINAEKGFFYCFGCQASGDLIDFYARINGLDFKESVKQLAEQAGVTLEQYASPGQRESHQAQRSEKQAMLAMHMDAGRHFGFNLQQPLGGECREYIRKRGLSPEIISHFELGWASRDWHALENSLRQQEYNLNLAVKCGLLGTSKAGSPYDRFRGRLIFPIKNLASQIIAFGGRIIADEEEAKYINSSDTPIYSKKEHLYGLPQARKGISTRGEIILTEGYMDVLTLHQFGYSNSVGVLGTALTEEQIHRISGFTSRICLLFDGDRAGRKAALRSAEMILSRGLDCHVVLQPEGEDIDSLLRGEGSGFFDKLRLSAPDGLSFCLATVRDWAPREALAWAKNFLGKIQIPELTSRYASLLAQKLGITENSLRAELNAPTPGSPARKTCLKMNDRDAQILLFAVRYPERMDDLRSIGADLALASKQGKEFWKLLNECQPAEITYHLNEEQKQFWIDNRGPLAPPRDNAEKELACLRQDMQRFFAKTQAQALQAAIAGATNDFAADLEYLKVFRDAMRHNNEQS